MGNECSVPEFPTGIPLQGGTVATVNNYNAGTNRINGASYDAAGNLLSFTGSSLTYDAENRITSATQGGIGSMYYLYDGAGRRVQEVSTYNVEKVFVYDAFGEMAAEYSIGGQSLPCTTCYISTDHLGSTRLVTDQNANVVGRHDYLPFGEEIGANSGGRNSLFGTQDFVNQKFTGQERDAETGLDFFQARYFSAALGRFNSPDRSNAGANLFNPQSWNGYTYVFNNPFTNTDPTGLCTFDGDGKAVGDEDGPCYNGGSGGSVTVDGGAIDSLPIIPFFYCCQYVSGEPSGVVEQQKQAPDFRATRQPIPPKSATPTPTQPCFNTAAFASTLDQNACPASKGQCARYVRLALEAGGINTAGRPNAAGDYGPFLQSKGFLPVSVQGYTPQVGDIAVFGKTDVHPYGHVTAFDAVNWVSDFIQRHMNPKAPATADA